MTLNIITAAAAFAAGLVSFLSPCVFPIVPGFLAYLAGASLEEAKKKRWEIFTSSVFFVLGFSVVFALLAVLLSTVLAGVSYEVQTWLSRIGGAIIIIFGLYLTGLLKLSFLDKEYKIKTKRRFSSRQLTAFVFGVAFAVGWTPCVGAVLGGILALAATQPGSAFILLFSYALGLGLPFLLVGLFAAQATAWMQKVSKWFTPIKIIFGIILVILGIMVFTQTLSQIANLELVNRFLLS